MKRIFDSLWSDQGLDMFVGLNLFPVVAAAGMAKWSANAAM
jgi:hypothetical protein